MQTISLKQVVFKTPYPMTAVMAKARITFCARHEEQLMGLGRFE